jgi:hypothetical protein
MTLTIEVSLPWVVQDLNPFLPQDFFQWIMYEVDAHVHGAKIS